MIRLFASKARPEGVRRYAQSTGRPGWSPRRRRAVRLLVWIVLAGAIVAGFPWGVRAYFRSCPLYVLRRATVETGGTLPADDVRSYLRLHEGSMPLFGTDISRQRDALLRDAPAVRDIVVSRHLPDRLVVRIVEREPLARLGRTARVLDTEGCVFVRYNGIEALPVITGFDLIAAVPGARLRGQAQAAIEVLERCRAAETELPVAEVDISREDALLCTMVDQRQVLLAWDNMGTRSAGSLAALDGRLRELLAAMHSDRGRDRRLWDVTVAGRVYAR
jgi:hypothetical protein